MGQPWFRDFPRKAEFPLFPPGQSAMDGTTTTPKPRQDPMFKTAILVAVLSTTLAGCMANDAQRALIGAAGGAVVADVTGNDMATGALIGGGIGLIAH